MKCKNHIDNVREIYGAKRMPINELLKVRREDNLEQLQEGWNSQFQ